MFLTRVFVVPNLPSKIFLIPTQNLMMLLFALIMLIASYFMLRKQVLKNSKKEEGKRSKKQSKIILGSFGIGVLTALIGAGGGFLIVPALISLFQINTKEAVGTSLGVIAANSLFGFGASMISDVKLNWNFLLFLCVLTIFGMLIGVLIGQKLHDQKLKKFFAYFIAAMAVIIFFNQLFQIL